MAIKKFSEFIAEDGLSRVYQHNNEGRNLGIISAQRSYTGAENDTKAKNEWNRQNNDNHRALGKDLEAKGYGFVRVNGRSNEGTQESPRWANERSYLVVGKKGDDGGKLFSDLKELGEKYKQSSILHKPHNSASASLHGLRDDGWPARGETVNVGTFHPNRIGDFHTALRHGQKTFTYESVYFYRPGTFLNREDQRISADVVNETIKAERFFNEDVNGRDPFLVGHKAFHEGKSLGDSPYLKSPSIDADWLQERWLCGYNKAKQG